MIPIVSTPVPTLSQSQQGAQKAALDLQSHTPRASAGEKSAANVSPATAQAIDAAEQYAVSPRLRDQETVENSARALAESDKPTGPPPAFEESLLARQARKALDPPEVSAVPQDTLSHEAGKKDDPAQPTPELVASPPPSPTERAEMGFAETRAIAAAPDSGAIDKRG